MNTLTQPVNIERDKLQQQIATLQKSEMAIESITDELKAEFDNVDRLLLQHVAEWSKHREEYFTKLTSQLETQHVTLNTEEKDKLRKDSNNINAIWERSQALQKNNIDVPKKASDFAIITYDIVTAALGRTLQKIDNKTVQNIVKSLSVIDEEDKAASKMKELHAEQYQTIADNTKQLKDRLDKMIVSVDEEQVQELGSGSFLDRKVEADPSTEPSPE